VVESARRRENSCGVSATFNRWNRWRSESEKEEMSKNALVFQDGSFIVGQSFGADKCISGELVFQTGFKTY
jgi:hypothetical protein